jgi:hypothetical protein
MTERCKSLYQFLGGEIYYDYYDRWFKMQCEAR